MIRLKIWKAIVDKIQTFACYINIGISIRIYGYMQFLMNAVSLSCNFIGCNFIASYILNELNSIYSAILSYIATASYSYVANYYNLKLQI